MIIKKIIKQKSGKYKIIFDDAMTLLTYDDVILNHNLLFNKDISMDDYQQIITDTNYYTLYNETIKYISKRLRSRLEIKKYLEKKTLDIHLIDDIIAKLEEKKYIDDYRFAQAFMNDKINFSHYGILKIKQELIQLGVSEDIVEAIAKEERKSHSDDNKLNKIIAKKIKGNHKYSSSYLKQKILNDLINIGYEREQITQILDAYTLDDREIQKKEYQKIYNKLKSKYKDKELEYQINLRMRVKGFK
ncbi:MAG: RecX family transcriptional regulator [Bacilli bacterium]|nr:RecX family transcriptional regulator [Bacilli bacterium]